MSNDITIQKFTTIRKLVNRFRDDLTPNDFVLLFAYNGTGKTRISMDFKDKGKQGEENQGDTLYFNAFTEDLFHWDNDLENDSNRFLNMNSNSNFFNGLRDLSLDQRIFNYFERYANIDFRIDYENWKISFRKRIKNPRHHPNNEEPEFIYKDNIKISRGEETIFIWCFFLAVCELVIDGAESYNWVNYIYVDDPVSSLDENNAIAIASDLTKLLKNSNNGIKTIISSHHILFFNVICNELKQRNHRKYFLCKNGELGYTLRNTKDTPYFHHVAILSELKQVRYSNNINTYHFNMLRSILEKTATFFGFDDFGKCIHGIEDEVLFNRVLNLLSHGAYSIYQPISMGDDTKDLFIRVLDEFLIKYKFELPEILLEELTAEQQVTVQPIEAQPIQNN